ncbi:MULTISPECIES: transglycosylase SLT domain-containing protein [unclassified Pseudomonas]|uniref:transglycosylase SLT domain-containing protein n=1 Tax=unclassified Pseudomonas TaxID=196821 RepID=UPI001CE0A388|nr:MULTISPECIES: transglycosylase SLT domain-containing protein [unclassified Pseudomonas]
MAGALASLLWAGGVLADCWEEAARRHDLEPQLLLAIAQVESGFKVDALHVNRDGSRDIGLMQINSQHLPRLSRRGITEPLLLSDPCVAVEAGAFILAEFVARHGYNWTAVGAYNAGSSPAREAVRLRYARKVWTHYHAWQVQGRPASRM